MNRLRRITGLLSALMIVLAAAGALCGSVTALSRDASLYGAQSREVVRETMGLSSEDEVTAYIGLDAQAQEALAQNIAAAMDSGEASFELDALNEREREHLRDVRDLMLRLERASKICISLAAALAVVIAWTGARIERRRRAVLLGAACGAGAVLLAGLGLLAAMHTAGFERLFIGVHELLFSNDLWLMNPETDVLIRMMPQALFERAAQSLAAGTARVLAVILVMLAAVYGLVGGMIRRNLAEREKA